ncbi:ABC transporter substrate-binding protein [Anaerococcus provencensis]|uniref:ABC transporter substrate-binding protein n=1 Tax=Anaerococcus provencensis TaxID=938293 RepID=UPI0002D7E27A|nr:ABC transporter substrate-binding protein [Anaerococcus provencensis]
MRYKKSMILILALSFLFTACGKKDETQNKADSTSDKSSTTESSNEEKKQSKDNLYKLTVCEDKDNFVINDYQGFETKIPKYFKSSAVLSGTPLSIWYNLGGRPVITAKISDNVKLEPQYEEEIKKIPDAGPVYSLNMEAVVEKKPDLVIAQAEMQGDLAEKLRDMGFSVITTKIKTFDDVINTYEAFGTLLNNKQKADQEIERLKRRREELIAKAPDKAKSVVILYVTSNSIGVKLNKSIAGDIATSLGIKNILENSKADNIGSENAYLDVEYIHENQPDMILVTSMVSDNDEAKKIAENEFKTNPVWKGVKAIEEGNVVYLPQQYFLYNAGPYYDKAIEYLARAVYPEIYGKLEDFDE